MTGEVSVAKQKFCCRLHVPWLRRQCYYYCILQKNKRKIKSDNLQVAHQTQLKQTGTLRLELGEEVSLRFLHSAGYESNPRLTVVSFLALVLTGLGNTLSVCDMQLQERHR